MEKDTVDEREERERAMREKEAQAESERKLKENLAAGSRSEEENALLLEPKSDEEVWFWISADFSRCRCAIGCDSI